MNHIPVLSDEIIKILDPRPNQNFIDATLGHGGHSKLLLEKTAPNGKLLAIEQDIEAINVAAQNLSKYKNRITIIHDNFIQIGLIIRKWKFQKIDGILIDLGPNTDQLTSEVRGLSFRSDAPLDMRLDETRQKTTAADILNNYSQKTITDILFRGEEKFAKQIAKKIVIARQKKRIETVTELTRIIKSAIPPSYRFLKNTHFATATFRALRMEVNNELANLAQVLPQALSALSPKGKIAVISFQSLEDRIVKNFFRERDQNGEIKIITTKPIIATEREITINPSARSAKLRAAIKN